MVDEKAVELRHEGKTYRASSREVFFRWAREHRIGSDDSYRVAGTDKWIPVTANSELKALLDPENWWKVTMGGKTYVAPDWETIVKWAREGRLSSDVQVEGPKTPPGGILGKASPELSPYLREWVYDDSEKQPVRVRFDGKTFIPGDLETLERWIRESRIPLEAEVSVSGDEWRKVTDCQEFSPEMWPLEDPDTGSSGNEEPPSVEKMNEPPESSPPKSSVESKKTDIQHSADGESLYRISTSYGEDYVFDDPLEVRQLLKRKKIHGFDEIRHPALPGGVMFVSEFIREYLPGKGAGLLMWILTVILILAGVAAIVFQQQDRQWMLIGGIAALAVALVLLIRLIWKK